MLQVTQDTVTVIFNYPTIFSAFISDFLQQGKQNETKGTSNVPEEGQRNCLMGVMVPADRKAPLTWMIGLMTMIDGVSWSLAGSRCAPTDTGDLH